MEFEIIQTSFIVFYVVQLRGREIPQELKRNTVENVSEDKKQLCFCVPVRVFVEGLLT